jgi:transposase
VFIDETGFFLHPLVRRTWAPCGQTPILRQRTRHHRKISTIGGISISPRRRRLTWYLHFHSDQSIRQEQIIAFLRDLLAHLRGHVIVVWDRLGAHRGAQVRTFARRRRRLTLEQLPAYAPELNPNEYGWSYIKHGKLANFCPHDLGQLEQQVSVEVCAVRTRQKLLRSFVRATELPIRM